MKKFKITEGQAHQRIKIFKEENYMTNTTYKFEKTWRFLDQQLIIDKEEWIVDNYGPELWTSNIPVEIKDKGLLSFEFETANEEVLRWILKKIKKV